MPGVGELWLIFKNLPLTNKSSSDAHNYVYYLDLDIYLNYVSHGASNDGEDILKMSIFCLAAMSLHTSWR